tara:strand:+ start:83 stop:370 length:288 start_codon:yes stop_codon:yes gene_type:complete
MTHNYRYADVNSDDSENEDLITYEPETDKEIISGLREELLKCEVKLEESKLSNKLKKLVPCGRAGLKPKKSRRKKKTKRVKKTKPRRKRQRTKKR